jgi:hypothetical protein
MNESKALPLLSKIAKEAVSQAQRLSGLRASQFSWQDIGYIDKAVYNQASDRLVHVLSSTGVTSSLIMDVKQSEGVTKKTIPFLQHWFKRKEALLPHSKPSAGLLENTKKVSGLLPFFVVSMFPEKAYLQGFHKPQKPTMWFAVMNETETTLRCFDQSLRVMNVGKKNINDLGYSSIEGDQDKLMAQCKAGMVGTVDKSLAHDAALAVGVYGQIAMAKDQFRAELSRLVSFIPDANEPAIRGGVRTPKI